MYHIDFPPLGAGKGLQFDWDPVSGTLSGRDAAFVMLAIQDALREGSITSHPWPTVYPVKNPLFETAELAVIISTICRVNDEWASIIDAYYKTNQTEIKESNNGTIN